MRLTKCLIATLWSGMSASDMASSIISYGSLIQQDNVILPIFRVNSTIPLAVVTILGEANICMRKSHLLTQRLFVPKNDVI